MFNRSALCQRAIAHPAILEVLEPLLGDDSHAIACTAWLNRPGNDQAPNGQEWHIDGGPHVPRAPGTDWPEHIPSPIFVVATQIYFHDVALDDGPTAFVPGSHTSGTPPPHGSRWELELEHRGQRCVPHLARAGDVTFFVSDVWHRRLPPAPGCARPLLPADELRPARHRAARSADRHVHHASPDAIESARSQRERTLIGLHPQVFYDG
jgi:hypothetical protein